MRLQIDEPIPQAVSSAEPVTRPGMGAELEAGRTLDRQRMEARKAVLSLRLRRLRRFRRGLARPLRRVGVLSLVVAMVGFGGSLLLSFWTRSSGDPSVMPATQLLVLGLQALFLLLLLSGAVYSASFGAEAALRAQARREGLELDE